MDTPRSDSHLVPSRDPFGLATQYQVGLFWLGLAFNAAGITCIGTPGRGRQEAAHAVHRACLARLL